MQSETKTIGIVPLLAVLALALAVWSFLLGPTDLSPAALFAGLCDGNDTAGIVAREIRLPRAVLALLVGAALGGSGAALQGLFRNPLAEPGVTGVTASAGLGAVCALYFGLTAFSPLVLPGLAITGALAAAGILFLLSRRGIGTVGLILAGVAVSSLATALTALALSLSHNPYAMSEMMLWLMGSLKDRTLSDVAYALPLVAAGLSLIAFAARGLDALSLGEDAARSLGIDVARVRLLVILGTALATGAATAVAGPIGFVGLVVPHVVRRLVTEDIRLALPLAAPVGALALVLADIAARTLVAPQELATGAMTALVGAPLFIFIAARFFK